MIDPTIREILMGFLDWYDPEASHRDIGLEGPVDDYLNELSRKRGTND